MGGVVKTIGSLFGGGDSAPQAQSAHIMSPVTEAQAKTAYDQQQQRLQAQQALATQLAGQNGIQNQSNVYNSLQNVATGQGYNPAQSMLNNATGSNVANQAALMASQRGASSNPGQIARLAAQQGASTQQQAVGQGAALQAQQSLGALGMQGGLANQMVANQMGQTNQAQASNLAEQQALLNSIAGVNTANVSNAQQQNAANASMYNNAQNLSGGLIGGLMGGAGSAIGGPFGSILGGVSKNMASGGMVDPVHNIYYSQGGLVSTAVSPGEVTLTPPQVKDSLVNGKSPIEVGQKVAGKAKVKGDSIVNDTVPKQQEAGSVVIPRSVVEGPNAHAEAKKFLADALRKNGKHGGEESDFKSALRRAAGARK